MGCASKLQNGFPWFSSCVLSDGLITHSLFSCACSQFKNYGLRFLLSLCIMSHLSFSFGPTGKQCLPHLGVFLANSRYQLVRTKKKLNLSLSKMKQF